MKNNTDFNYAIEEGFDYVLEEGGNQSINLRRISWNGRPSKIDIRKYTYKDGKEMMLKGISLSDEGVTELAGVLIERGYGDTRRIIKALREREDFDESMLDKNTPLDDDSEEETYYDPKELFGG